MDGEYSLGLNDLATNLFTILKENNSKIKKVTLHQLSEFEKILLEEAKKKNLKFKLVLSREEIFKFFRDCGGIFCRDENKEINIGDLIPSHIYDMNVLEVMMSENVVDRTLNMMGAKKKKTLPKKRLILMNMNSTNYREQW